MVLMKKKDGQTVNGGEWRHLIEEDKMRIREDNKKGAFIDKKIHFVLLLALPKFVDYHKDVLMLAFQLLIKLVVKALQVVDRPPLRAVVIPDSFRK